MPQPPITDPSIFFHSATAFTVAFFVIYIQTVTNSTLASIKSTMILTLLTLALASAGFIWGRIRADVIALIALMALVVGGVITTQEALSGFSNSIVIMMLSLIHISEPTRP